MSNVDNCEISDSSKMDITIDIDMSYLDLGEGRFSGASLQSDSFVDELDNETTNNIRRSKRKRFRPMECENRRSTTKPRKLLDNDSKETVNYYLDKRVKKLPSTLETIFEEPKSGIFMSSRRLKRSINFPDTGVYCKDKLKVKKRLLKAKKVHPVKNVKKRASMDLLMKKLLSLEKDD